MEVVQIILQEFVQNRTVEQIIVPVGHGVEVYLLPQELDETLAKLRAEDGGGDSTCASGAHPRTNCGAGCRYPLPQIMEEMMEVVLFVPRTRQSRTVEQIVDVSILQIQEETSELASFGVHSTWHRFCELRPPVPMCRPAQP